MSVFQTPSSGLNLVQCAAKYVISSEHADLQAGVARIHYLYYMYAAYSAIDAYAVEDEEGESVDAGPSEQGTCRSAASPVAHLGKRGDGGCG